MNGRLQVLGSLLRRVEIALLVVWIALAGVVWAFLSLGSEMREGELAGFDLLVLNALRRPGAAHVAIGPPWLTETMRDLTALGGLTVLAVMTILAVVLLLGYRRRLEALVLGVGVPLAQLSSGLLKDFYERVRPSFAVYGDLPSSMSFPSGHSTTATAAYFILAVIVSRADCRPSAKVFYFAVAALLSVMIGFSRVYLGVHWPTDVVAGWRLGSAWALIAALALRFGERRSGGRSLAVTRADFRAGATRIY